MRTSSAQTLLAWIAIASVLQAGVPAPIAIVQSSGEFRLDGKTLRTSGSVPDGSVVEALAAASDIQWTKGKQGVALQPGASAAVYRNRIVLQKGTAEARTLRVTGAGLIEVSLTSTGGVGVMPESGVAEVRGSSGQLIARVFPNLPLVFDPQGNATEPSKVTGCLVTKGSSYVLTDTTTNVAVEVQGANLSTYVGRRIEASGPMSSNSAIVKEADQLLRANAIRDLGPCPKGALTPAAGRGGVAGKAAGTAGGHASVMTVSAIVGGVAVAGSVIGLAAAGTFSGSSSASPSQ
jgi:hypothetical protein